MTDFIIYILKSSLALGLLYGLYFLLFRRETFYHYNRIYILGALVISLVFPALHIQVSQPTMASENNFERVNYVFLDFSETLEYVKATTEQKVASFPVIPYLLLAGMLAVALRIGFQLFSIYKNIKKYEIRSIGKYHYVLIDQHYSTHSFFNYIFVHQSEFRKKHMREVLVHEQMHANQLHSIDLLFIGFLSVLQWFNPFIYLFKRALVETHEFQADQAVIARGIDPDRYQRLLLEHARSVVTAGFTSSFNQSIIKNRLKMMNKIKSGRGMILKYLMVFPVIFFVGIVFAISQERIEDSLVQVINISNEGDQIAGTSDFAVVDLPEGDDRINFHAQNLIDFPEVVRMKNAQLETMDKSIRVNAANILINKKERRLYAFTDDYVPSIMPVDKNKLKRIASGFGMRMHPILKVRKFHNGSDFSAPAGTEIYATANGHIRTAEFDKDQGNWVIIDHGNGYSTGYSHMKNYIVNSGEAVRKGDVIGYVGNTGMSKAPHLHYSIMKDGEYVDPAGYLGEVE